VCAPIRLPERTEEVTALAQELDTPVAQLSGGGAFPGYIPTKPVASGGMQGNLLVVDDVEANRDVLSRRLTLQGYTVATAENGRVALEKLRATSFDLVLLDILMPEMDGYEVLQRLMADEEFREIPVIMISALSEREATGQLPGKAGS
jgi:CheY-like chemotaxis protein